MTWVLPDIERRSWPVQEKGHESTEVDDNGGNRPGPAPVTVDNFPRAETDMYFADSAARGGQLSTPYHYREPMAIDNQTVVRTNRDSLYSSIVVDLEAGQVTVTLPDPGERFMSMIVINEDHYAFTVYAPGSLSTGRTRSARAI